jgi:hypothetical protein
MQGSRFLSFDLVCDLGSLPRVLLHFCRHRKRSVENREGSPRFLRIVGEWFNSRRVRVTVRAAC